MKLRRPASEALPVNNLRSLLLVFLQTYPRQAEGLQVGQHCSPAPHGEDSVLRAADVDVFPRVGAKKALDFRLESLGEPRQQGVSTFKTFWSKMNWNMNKQKRIKPATTARMWWTHAVMRKCREKEFTREDNVLKKAAPQIDVWAEDRLVETLVYPTVISSNQVRLKENLWSPGWFRCERSLQKTWAETRSAFWFDQVGFNGFLLVSK